MNDQDMHELKSLLSARRQELLAQLTSAEESTRTVNLDQSSVGRLSRMDALQSRQMALAAKRRQEVELTRIDAALERIEADEFGCCASCREEINPKRLAVDPANPFRVDCAAKIQAGVA